ncbi:MAG: M48 family metallopeptidase [Culturomica sp.]|jgi:predicted metal-dependent hydrolase|nr:M48 family metallopeptidase [Culturomica sp.]
MEKLVNIQGIGVVKLRRGRNIKHLSIRMAAGRGIWLNVPWLISYEQAIKFLQSQTAWIDENRKKFVNIESRKQDLQVEEEIKRACREFMPARVEALACRHGFSYGRLSFRNNVSNWGSCSWNNNISLNVKLMRMPDEVIDYVIIHELCHTVEKNHSDRFWALVEKCCPDYRRLRAYLKTKHTAF